MLLRRGRLTVPLRCVWWLSYAGGVCQSAYAGRLRVCRFPEARRGRLLGSLRGVARLAPFRAALVVYLPFAVRRLHMT